MAQQVALDVEDVSVTRGGQEVLKDVNLSLEKGQFLGIIGPNGGGKTTFLKVLLGLIEPDEGKITILGRSPKDISHEIGYVPQYSNFDSKFPISVWEVVLMGRLGNLGWKPFYTSKDKKIAQESLEMVEMEAHKEKQISNLSGGQQQRVLIARALTTEPEFLLLDEPTASVDEKVKNNINELLKKLNQEKEITMILASHDIGVISSYVSKIACMNKYLIYHGGKELSKEMLEASYECPVDLIAHGTPHRVFEHKMPEENEEGDE